MEWPAASYGARALSLTHNYSAGERLADRIGHIVGIAGSVLGLVWLVLIASRHSSTLMVTSFAIYGGALVFSYVVSALYHDAPGQRLKSFLRVLDHAAVYLLIAGTYTPVALVALNGAWGWSLFGVEWFIAGVGIVLKALFPGRFEGLSIVLYLVLGWAGTAALGQLIENVPWPGLVLMGAGGILFTSGVFFHTRTKLRYHNLIWHSFVLAGAACHVCMMLFYIRPAG